MTTLPDLLSTDEAAEYLGFNRPTIDRLCRAGKLPATKVGGRWFISRSRLTALFGGGEAA